MTNKIDPQTGYKISPRTGKPEHAVLTDGQRQYLQGDSSGYTSSSQTDYEKAIVRRVYNSYLDLSLICKNLPESRREEIFDIGCPPADDEEEQKLDMAANTLHDGLNDTIALLFLLLEGDYKSTGMHDQIRQLTFRRVLKPGVSKAVKHLEGYEWPWIPSVDVDFNVEVSEPDAVGLDRTIDKIAEGNVDELSGGEIRSLIGIVDTNESFPGKSTFGVGGWEDLGEQIQERRAERDDIITREYMEELAELPDEEAWKRLEERRSNPDDE
jgi:hypothetical protein